MREPTAIFSARFPPAEILNAQTALERQERRGDAGGLAFAAAVHAGHRRRVPDAAADSGDPRRRYRKDVPVLIGTNRDEWKLFTAMFRQLREISEDERRPAVSDG